MASGVGTDDVTNILAVLLGTRYHRVAFAQQDSTNIGLWETQTDTKAGPLVGMTEHLHVATNGTLSAFTSLAQTTLNNPRFCALWMLNSESPPSEIAAAMAAMSIAVETAGVGAINATYDGMALRGIAPSQFATGDNPTRTTKQSALSNSVTPIETVDGKAVVVRAITTKSLLSSTPDYRTLDVADARVTDWIRDDVSLLWTTDFVVANPHVRADPSAEEPEPPAGAATPSKWAAAVTKRMTEHEANNIVTAVETAAGKPQAEYNSTANRIDSAVPVIRLPHQHAIGISVRQLNVSDAVI
jgi:phage tail sheath gpL-like